MASRKRLKNLAAGLLGSFVSRNNGVEAFWAPGVLYDEADGQPLRLDMLTATAAPPGTAAAAVAGHYAELLRRGLIRERIDPVELVEAVVELRFDTPARAVYYQSTGEPFDASITLRTCGGHVVTRQEHGRCYRQAPGRFPPDEGK